MTQSILYGEYHILSTSFVHGFILVRDDDTGQIIRSYEGLATGSDGQPKVIGVLPSDLIKVYSNDGPPRVYSTDYPQQVLFTGSSDDVGRLLQAADLAKDAINGHNIGYPTLGVIPTGNSMDVSNSNAVISSLLHIMNLPDPGPTSGIAPGRGTLLFVPGEENGLRNYLGLPNISEDGDAILQKQSYGYEYNKADESGNQIYDIKYDDNQGSETINGNAPDLTVNRSNLNFADNSSGRLIGDFDNINAGSGSKVNFDGTSIQITATYASLNLEGGSSANVFGSNSTINLQANSNGYAGIFGQNQTVTGDTGDNTINLGGDGTSATVAGGGYVGLCGNNESLTLTDPGSSVQTAGGVQNETVYANGSTISLAANSLANINGSSDTINLQGGSNETIGIAGQGLTVTGDAGNDVVNLGANTSATVAGGGDVGLCGNGATLKAEADQAFTINTAPNVTNDTVYADNSTINLTPGWSGSIYGEGLNINMSPDSGSNVTVYGYDDQVTGNQGDTVHADAYDPNDTSDPYAPYEPGDPAPGTPYDPGDPDPTDPGDPDPDDDDDDLVAVKAAKSSHTAASASAAHGTSHTHSASAATPASSAPPATDSSSHIATQASQLASAMAAFGGASAGDSSLHAGTPAAHTTLAADPSQATHTLRHAA